MNIERKDFDKYEKAQKRVGQIKGFYKHVAIFIIFNGVLLLSKNAMTVALFGAEALGTSKAMDWVDWNIYIWLSILAIHALLVFGKAPFFVKKWEERQIERFIKEQQEGEKHE